MAATLLVIKMRMLMPTHAGRVEEEEEDPRADLVRRLLEYKRFKEAARRLRECEDQRQPVPPARSRASRSSTRPTAEPALQIEMYDLLAALADIFDRVQTRPVHEIVREPFTVDEKIDTDRALLGAGDGTVRFEELLPRTTPSRWRSSSPSSRSSRWSSAARSPSCRPRPTARSGPPGARGAAEEPRRRSAAGEAAGDGDLKRELEALLFATDSPLTMARLKKIFPERGDRGDPRRRPGTGAGVRPRPATPSPSSSSAAAGRSPPGPTTRRWSSSLLSRAASRGCRKAGLEVLAIIAYRQPITRLEIEEIRGVNSSGAISTLTERNLITVVGRSAGRRPPAALRHHARVPQPPRPEGPRTAAGLAGARGRASRTATS